MLLLPGSLCLGLGGRGRLAEFRHFCIRRTRNRSGGRALRIQECSNVPALLVTKEISCPSNSSPAVGSLKGEGCTAVIVTSAPDMLLSESEADIVRKSFTTLQALG